MYVCKGQGQEISRILSETIKIKFDLGGEQKKVDESRV